MQTWQRIGKQRAVKAVALATVLAVAMVAPGGAFVAGASNGSGAQGSGGSFEAFIAALADDAVKGAIESSGQDASGYQGVIQSAVQNAVKSAFSSGGQADQSSNNDVVQQVTDTIGDVGNVDLGNIPQPDLSDNQAEAQQINAASTADVIAALLALLTGALPEVMEAIDLGEAAVIAKLTQAKAQVIAAFAQAGSAGASGPEMEALKNFALQQIDAAIVMIGGVFDQIRALVTAAFNEARDTIIRELTGIDLGEGIDIVLGKIAEIQTWVTNMLTGVQTLLQQLGAGLPVPLP